MGMFVSHPLFKMPSDRLMPVVAKRLTKDSSKARFCHILTDAGVSLRRKTGLFLLFVIPTTLIVERKRPLLS